VVYSTDNGPHMNTWPDGAMTWFRSEKNTNWEGAFRVPCLVRWPGVIQPGTVTNELEPLCCIHGVSSKVLSMACANLLLGADPSRERWVTTGASMVAVDTLVHNWLHRTGSLRRLGAEHAYGPACYGPTGCASIIEETARRIDARQFCPDGPAFFPRLLQKAIWMFCAEAHLGICNGNRIDDSRRTRLPFRPVIT